MTLLPAGELFQALEKGVLDGTEFSLRSIGDQLGFYKVAKLCCPAGTSRRPTSISSISNSAVWDKLNATTKAQIETTCTAARHHLARQVRGRSGQDAGEVRKEGVKLVKASPELLAACTFQKATGEVWPKIAKDPCSEGLRQHDYVHETEIKNGQEFGYLPRDFK